MIRGNIQGRGTVGGDIGGRRGVNGNITNGSGGGSTVSITPVLETGVKIADYEIDGESGELFAPSPVNYNIIKYDLYHAPDINGAPFSVEIQLNDNINNYDIIGILISNPTDITNANIYCTQFVMPLMINDGKLLSFQPYGTRVLNYSIQNDVLIQTISTGDHPYYNRVYQIWGIKLGAIV